jgi:hypothetical protein
MDAIFKKILKSDLLKFRAAEYALMSTGHQQYSTLNQTAAIARYGAERRLTVQRSPTSTKDQL